MSKTVQQSKDSMTEMIDLSFDELTSGGSFETLKASCCF